jgi:hypothetical protein
MAISSGVVVTKLSAEERSAFGFTHRCVVPYSTIVSVGGATTTATVAIFDVFAGDLVREAGYVLTTAFTDSDASLNSITLAVGDGGSTGRFGPAGASQLAADGTEIIYFCSLGGGTAATSTCPFAYNTTDTVDALFTVAGGGDPTCAELTAGSVSIYLNVVSMADLENGTQ